MVKIIRSLAFVFLSAVSAAAVAAPAHLYNFNVIQVECMGPWSSDCQFANTYIQELSDYKILITPESFISGSAALNIEAPGSGVAPTIVNSGIAGMTLYSGRATSPVMLDANDYDFTSGLPFFLYAGLDVGPRLGGSINSADSFTDMEMQAGGLVGPGHLGEMFTVTDPLEWVGYVASDRLNTAWLRFTGEWIYAGEVPEPGTLALLIVALAGATVASRRTRRQGLGVVSNPPEPA